MDLATADRPKIVARNAGIEEIEAEMLALPQVECPVVHRFGPIDPETGLRVYIRELTMYAGTLAIGHRHRKACLNRMLSGKVAVVDGGEVKMLQAPLEFHGKAGDRKVGYVIEDTVWENHWIVDTTDIEAIERHVLDKSATWQDFENECSIIRQRLHTDDRNDFESMLDEYGFDAATVRAQSENEDDQIPMPDEWIPYTTVRQSPIEGQGLFLNWPIAAGEVVAPGRTAGKRTPAGRYVNHSPCPNCRFVANSSGDIYLVALRSIGGAKGGEPGEELTVDYRQSLALGGIRPIKERDSECQD